MQNALNASPGRRHTPRAMITPKVDDQPGILNPADGLQP
jgi:hypothetical protein